MNSTATICALNDALRTLTGEGRICFTAGIAALPRQVQAKIMERVFDFDEFTPENDPHGEHDCFPSGSPIAATFRFSISSAVIGRAATHD
jgi:hypothetical protein